MTERGGDGRASGGPPEPQRPQTSSGNGLESLGRTGPGPDAPGDRDKERKVANEAGLMALAEEMHGPKKGRAGRRHAAPTTRRRRRVKRGVLIGLAVLVLLVGGGAGYIYYLTHGLHRVEVKGLHGELETGAEAGAENILMVGSTSRCALKVQNPAYGLCQGSANSPAVNGVNSDVIMILHVNPAKHQLALLSIPRDLFIPNARSEGANKIDAGLFEGLSQVVSAIEEDFGIPIQHAVSLNFDQFANVVDALGGVNMSFPMSLFDASSGLNVQAAPCVHLNGTQALEVVRARHLLYKGPGVTSTDPSDWPADPESDLSRIRRDHEFLRVLATAVAHQGLGDPISDVNLINSVKSDLTFDQSWSVSDMAHLVLAFHSVDINSVPQLTMPVAQVIDPAGESGDLIYQGGNYNEVEFPAQSQDQGVIDQVLSIGANTDSMTGNPLPATTSIAVSVMNGSGAYNQATDTSTALAALGFKIAGIGDTTPVGDVAETVVYYGSKSPATEAAAEKVARSMTGSVIMAYDPSQVSSGATVTVVTGTQFAVNAPSPSTIGGTAGSSAATSAPTTTTNPAAAAITPPSSANTNLQKWDPRACPAGATPTAPVANQLPG
jgi:LCP family protein required for cell wall assembly